MLRCGERGASRAGPVKDRRPVQMGWPALGRIGTILHPIFALPNGMHLGQYFHRPSAQ
jgi:hypothetical protein